MADQSELESLYREAQSALKVKNYDRASNLFRQILIIDENYKDTSRLLAQTVRLRRRRWYNHPFLWGTLGLLVLIATGIVLVPRVQEFYAIQPTAPATNSPTATLPPTVSVTATETPLPTPTPVSLTWKRVSIGQEFERDKIIAFEINPKDPDVLYVNMENAGYYQSIDGGISWQPVQIENLPADVSTKLITNNDHNQDEEYTVMNIGPDGKERIYSPKTANWFISEDGGKIWSEFGIIGKPQSNAITFDSQGSVYVYCDSHLCKYSLDGKQKVTLGNPDVGAFTIIAISSYDPSIFYAAGKGLAVSKDFGLTWSKLNNGLGGESLELDMQLNDPLVLFLQSGKCNEVNRNLDKASQPLYLSTDNGRSWSLSIETGCYLAKDANGSTIYRIGLGVEPADTASSWIGWIWRSDDEGKSWQRVFAPSGALTLVAHPFQSGTLYYNAGGDFGDILARFISEDYGHKWKVKDPPIDAKLCYGSTLQFIDAYRPMAIDPSDGNHVFVIDNGILLESHNSCDTTSAFATAPSTSMNSIAFDPNDADTLFGGTDGGAHISFDSGTTWNQINDGLLGATVVYSIAVDKDGNVYAATPYGIFKLERQIMTADLERLYQEAKSALASRDFHRASHLLRQILIIDENYKDTSRLLAQTVKLRRMRWYNHPLLWGILGALILVGLGIFIAPKISSTNSIQPPAPTSTTTATLPPIINVTPTETLLPTPTLVPFVWKRVSIGQEFERDTVTAFVIDPKDPEVLYTGMKNAGIFKSIDGGLSWRPAHYGLANAHIKSLLIDSQNPSILYAGTIGGIFKTEDGGENWSKIGAGIYLLMDPQDSSHLYARDAEGIYESDDQGKSWETIYSSKEGCPGKIISWDIHPVDGKTLFIGAGEECEPGLYLSTDSGHTWAMIWSLQPTDYNFQYLDRLAIGADKQGNYYIASTWGLRHSQSNNGRIDWRFMVDFAPPATFDSAGSVYSYCDTHLCKFNLDEEQMVKLGKPDVGGFTAITISPYDPNTIYVSGEGISVSRDGGLTWTNLNNGLGSEVLYLDVSSGDTPVLYLQSGECEEARRTTQKKYYLGAFQDDAGQPLYISANGGRTWDLSLQNGCYLVRDANDMILYRVGQDWVWTVDGDHLRRWLWLSKDQGKSWQGVYIMDIGWGFTVVTDPFKSGILYAFSTESFDSAVGTGGGEKKIISEDYGNAWKNSDAVTGIKSCYGSTPQFIDAYRPMAIDPVDGNHVFVIDNGTLLESHDSCDTTSAFGTAPNTSMNSIAFDPNNSDTIYAGTDGGAYVSYDSGQSWGQVNDGLLGATVVYSIVVDKDSNVYAATPYGIFKLEGK